MIVLDAIASVFTCIGVIIALISLFQLRRTYLSNHERSSKQATIELFHDIKNASLEAEKFLFLNYETAKFEPQTINLADINDETLFEIKQFLSRLERFSVGVNLGVYDLNVANRLSGSYFINTYYQLHPLILDIRKKRADSTLYEEFESMVKKIEELREPKRTVGGELRYSPMCYEADKKAKGNHNLNLFLRKL